MLYSFLEMSRAAMMPWRAAANATREALRDPHNPVADTLAGRAMAASADVFESLTRQYGKPDWGFDCTRVNGLDVPVETETVWSKPFCSLVHFKRDREALAKVRGVAPEAIDDPVVLIVAPMSGHHATLLRGTVQTFLPDADVYITDWADARMVAVDEGAFDLDDFVDYVRAMITEAGPGANVVAVCQPGPATLAAVALMAEDEDPARPATMTFMGSPIDTRKSPTVPNKLAEERPYSWFRDQLIHTVPAGYPGALRRVYPGFLQLTGFINMNLDRHVDAHWQYFNELVAGDGDSADNHRAFYDEYLSVMDLTEEFYLQTICDVFQEQKLARGNMTVRGRPVRPDAIRDVALLTVEGENDDISGIGQTQAAHALCTGLSDSLREDYVQPGVGHYGVFNGSRFADEIAPRMRAFMARHARK
ncbi:polyhydroxyalkanoate depolymerase [Marinicauda pacifica]|jgi:poly(3-hydroxybutyrate) depolymerase|uniref:polyhydroxyalkanoate depolymerase n=1 Tax=Marinicauda pacifica TaxID=1133559 RepID=UPI0035C78F29